MHYKKNEMNTFVSSKADNTQFDSNKNDTRYLTRVFEHALKRYFLPKKA